MPHVAYKAPQLHIFHDVREGHPEQCCRYVISLIAGTFATAAFTTARLAGMPLPARSSW